MKHGEREIQLLLSPAAQLRYPPVHVLPKPECLEKTPCGIGACDIETVRGGEQMKVLSHREAFVYKKILRTVSYCPSGPHLTAIRAQETRDDLQKRALAAPVLANDPDNLATEYSERYPGQDSMAPEGMADPADVKHGFTRCVHNTPLHHPDAISGAVACGCFMTLG